jgi:uncharacterized membrane protein
MNPSGVFIWLRQAARALVITLLFSMLLPLIFGYAFGIPGGLVLGLVGSTLVLQANGAFVGVGFGLQPFVILTIMTSVEVGAFLAIFAICDTFAMKSERIGNFMKKTETGMQKYPWMSKYGPVSLTILPALPVIGLYASVVIAWLLRWNRSQSLLFITIGWIGVVIFLFQIALGFLTIIF